MKTIKSVNVGSFVLYGAVLMAFWTFVIGLYYWILGWIFGAQAWWIDMHLLNWSGYTLVTFLAVIWRSLLNALGVAKGDRVALILPNTPQMVFALLGTWKLGGIVVPLNPLYTEHEELEHALLDCEAETAVVLTPFYAKLKAIQSKTKLRHVIATNIKEYLPPTLRMLFTLQVFYRQKNYCRSLMFKNPSIIITNILFSFFLNSLQKTIAKKLYRKCEIYPQ